MKKILCIVLASVVILIILQKILGANLAAKIAVAVDGEKQDLNTVYPGDGKDALIVRVSDFGAVGDGINNDGPGIQKAFEFANSQKVPTTIVFEKKTYRLGERTDSWKWFILRNAKNVSVYGNGATLLFSRPTNQAFFIEDCENIKMSDLTIDYDEVPWSQGDIIAIDNKAKTFDIKIHDGYPLPPSDEWMKKEHVTRNGGWWFGNIFKKDQDYTKRGVHNHQMIDTVNNVSPGVYRIKLAKQFSQTFEQMEIGDRFVIRNQFKGALSNAEALAKAAGGNQSNGTIESRNCKNITFFNINIYATIHMAIIGYGNEGEFVLDGINIIRKPNTDRLVSSVSDGMHLKGNRVGPKIVNCSFDGLLDDSINIGAFTNCYVKEKKNDTTLSLDITTSSIKHTRVGDVLVFYNWDTNTLLGEAVVTSVSIPQNTNEKTYIVTLDRAIEGIKAGSQEDTTVTYYWNKSVSGNGYLIKNNTFKGGRRYAALLKSEGVFEGNIINNLEGVVLLATKVESPIPQNITIKDNTFKECFRYGVNVAIATGNITIENNTFDNCQFAPLSVSNAKDVTLINNTTNGSSFELTGPTATKVFSYVNLANSKGIKIDGLTVTDNSDKATSLIQSSKIEDIELTANNINLQLKNQVPIIVKKE